MFYSDSWGHYAEVSVYLFYIVEHLYQFICSPGNIGFAYFPFFPFNCE